MKQGGEFEMVQCIDIEGHGLSDHEGNIGGVLSMAGLPGQRAVDLLGDLTSEDRLDIPAGTRRQAKTVYLAQHCDDPGQYGSDGCFRFNGHAKPPFGWGWADCSGPNSPSSEIRGDGEDERTIVNSRR